MPVLYYFHNTSCTVKILDKKLLYSAFIKLVVFENMILSAPKKKAIKEEFSDTDEVHSVRRANA